MLGNGPVRFGGRPTEKDQHQRAPRRRPTLPGPCAISSSSRSPATPSATEPAGRRPGRAQPAVHRLGRDRLPPPRALRDRGAAAGALAAGGPFPLPAVPGRAARRRSSGSEHRTVTKTALVSLQGNTYQVDPLLVGRRVELVFDPFDLTDIAVRYARTRLGSPRSRTGSAATPTPRPDPNPTRAAGTDRDRLPGLIDTTHTEPGSADQLRRPARPTAPAPRRRHQHRRRGRRRRAAQPGATAASTPTASAPERSPSCWPGAAAVDAGPDADPTERTAYLAAKTDLLAASPTPTRHRPPGDGRGDGGAAMIERLQGLCGLHPHPVRPRPGPRDAAPPHQPRRGRRPDQLVHQRTRPRCDHRRGRRREDRRRPRRAGRRWTPPATPSSTSVTPRSGPAASTTPSSPPWAAPPASTTPPWSRKPPTPSPSSTPNAAAPRSWSSTRRTCSTTSSSRASGC